MSRSARKALADQGGSGAVDLDWDEFAQDIEDIAMTGRDLRLLVIAVRVLVNQRGVAGLFEGLTLLADTVRLYWQNLHPALRDNPSPRQAALGRINTLYQIENADTGILCDLEYCTLINLRGLGVITGGDLAAATLSPDALLAETSRGLSAGEIAALTDRHDARVTRVTTACRALAAEQPEALAALQAQLGRAEAALAGLEEALRPHVTEKDVTVRYPAMARFLARCGQTLAGITDPGAKASDPGSPAAQQPAPGQIASRADVERCLDQIIAFYERTEPASPIPHMARRMRRMVPMNFMQLMEEVAPSGIKEFRNVAGIAEDRNRQGARNE